MSVRAAMLPSMPATQRNPTALILHERTVAQALS